MIQTEVIGKFNVEDLNGLVKPFLGVRTPVFDEAVKDYLDSRKTWGKVCMERAGIKLEFDQDVTQIDIRIGEKRDEIQKLRDFVDQPADGPSASNYRQRIMVALSDPKQPLPSSLSFLRRFASSDPSIAGKLVEERELELQRRSFVELRPEFFGRLDQEFDLRIRNTEEQARTRFDRLAGIASSVAIEHFDQIGSSVVRLLPFKAREVARGYIKTNAEEYFNLFGDALDFYREQFDEVRGLEIHFNNNFKGRTRKITVQEYRALPEAAKEALINYVAYTLENQWVETGAISVILNPKDIGNDFVASSLRSSRNSRA